MAKWHYVAGGKPVGPVTADDIHERFQEGTIDRDTLAWTEGMPGWQPIHEVDDFNSLTTRSVPPPIPRMPPAVPNPPIPAMETDFVPELKIDERPASANEKEQIELSNLRASEPRIPWSRYFARTLDVSILATVLLTCSLLITPYVSIPLSLYLYTADNRLLLLFSLPFVMVFNAMRVAVQKPTTVAAG